MEAINIPNIKVQEKADNRMVFVIEPFFPGYGTTVGNGLRRVLLSSLPGAAVIAVKIKGIDHEFSPIPGVKEDAVQVILNLKSLAFKMHDEETVSMKLKSTKAGTVTGRDIAVPSNVELINPDTEIATLASNSTLEIEIWIRPGRGYTPSEDIVITDMPVGTIAVDAAFSPIEKVAFKVEPTRVGEVTNYDKLTLDVLTDGTIAPNDALKQSAQILVDQLTIFGATPADIEEVAKTLKVETTDSKDYSIEEMNFSLRTSNALLNNGIKNVSDILNLGPEKLAELKGLGQKALDEIVNKLEELGLKFKEE
ncbi:MAG: DNA-directed RNA polymerase subunit alpha [Patescibacteria group bacterium]|nr:DNA-directed RNA polymerase subunit alpha [Patescibacteria group bacterium]